MQFELFSRLYDEALEYEDCEMYVSERGWQADWMDAYADKDVDIGLLLIQVWDLSRMDARAIRIKLGVSQAKMADMYGIPKRTIEDWEAGRRRPPDYVTKLVAYTIVDN